MSRTARAALACLFGAFLLGQTGCNTVPRHQLQQSQARAMQLYDQNKKLVMERDALGRANGDLTSQYGQLQQKFAGMESANGTLQARIDNLNNERSSLQSSYADLLAQAKSQPSPLSDETTRRLEDLMRRYPNFEFDPKTGVSKFHSDILFESGDAEIRTAADPMLKEFAQILGSGDAANLNILVVGHTDDRRIVKASTAQKHPTNWHLSAHRAINVTRELAKFGLKEGRMGVAGYGPYQPVAPNRDAKSRERNRRIEIFVLAPNAPVAGWDRGTIRN